MNDKEQQEAIDRRNFFRYVALTTIGVPAMKAASIARKEADLRVIRRIPSLTTGKS